MNEDGNNPVEKAAKDDQIPKSETPNDKKDSEELEVENMVKGMPPEVRRIFQSVSMSSKSGFYNPIYEKINEKHIEKIIDYSRDDEKDNNKLKSSNRYFHLGYTILALAFLVFLIVYLLPANMQLLVEILKLLVIFFAGVGSGFGLKSHLDKKHD